MLDSYLQSGLPAEITGSEPLYLSTMLIAFCVDITQKLTSPHSSLSCQDKYAVSCGFMKSVSLLSFLIQQSPLNPL